jgi:hypothetical protein
MGAVTNHAVTNCTPQGHRIDRRGFLLAAGAVAAGPAVLAADPPPRGKADHCIFIWLGGGMAQTDTFDPKRLGDPAKKQPGSYYPAIATAVSGVQVCHHLRRVAPLLDRMTILRTVHHDVIDEHAAAVNRMHTGRPVSGTVVYPSIGSIVAQQRGPAAAGAPPYVLIGYPNVTRGPGFLGGRHGYLYLTDTASGPAGLSRPVQIDAERHKRREQLLTDLRRSGPQASARDTRLADYEAALEQSLRLSGPAFTRVFDLKGESAALRESYGGEFGQRCLLARRLVERGVRFIEVSHNLNFVNGTGWDAHNTGILKQHLLIEELDQALAALVMDLEKRKLLDRVLIVVSTEFGRPPEFDSGGGRGHHSKAFSVVLAGGGLRHQGAYGATDDLARLPVEKPVSVPDLFATIHTALGIDPAKNLYDGDRPVPITDNGRLVGPLFA